MKIRKLPLKVACAALPTLCLLLLCVLSLALPVHAQGSAVLTGPSEIRPEETVTLSFSVSGESLLGVSCRLVYNESHLTLQSIEAQIAEPWIMATSGNRILLYDDLQSMPIGEQTLLFTLSFKIKGTLEPGTEIRVALEDIQFSDSDSDINPESAVWSLPLGKPLSSDASLSSLIAENAVLSPEFSPSKTSYTTTVPYSVRSLAFSIVTSHPEATYRISGNTLSVGSNRISIRVTAEDGSTRTYRITVTREQDPDYVPSNDAALSEIIPSDGSLSPTFSPDITDYVLYLPNEITAITLHGTPRDSKGSVTDLRAELKEGQNKLTLIGTAENGSEMSYHILAIRLPAYSPEDGPIWPPPETLPPETLPPETLPPETLPPETIPPETLPTETTVSVTIPPETPPSEITFEGTTAPAGTAFDTEPSEKQKEDSPALTAILMLIIGIISLSIGYLGGRLPVKGKNAGKTDEHRKS